MQAQRSEPQAVQAIPLEVRNGLLVVPGYGLRVSVHHGRLQVRNNHLGTESTVELARATAGLKRLVVIGHSGFITFDAIRWLHDIGASYAQIDADGSLLASYAPAGTNDAPLRRAQALAATGDGGLTIAKRLVADKLEAQQRLLEASGLANELTLRPIVEARAHIAKAVNADELRWCEAIAATVYWNALAGTPIRFVRAELARVPVHWRAFGPRQSPITNRTTRAISPAAAMTNYLYAILESETRIALLTKGLDPEIGMLHSLQRSRSSLALDVMEPVRPAVDRFVLDLLATRVFSAGDFAETREGSCRLTPGLARILANTAPRWAAQLRPVVASVLAELQRERPATRTPAVVRRAHFPGTLHRRTATGSLPDAPLAPSPRCAECGAALSRARYARCSACDRERQSLLAPELGGVRALARLRAAGADPAHGGKAGRKRSLMASKRHTEAMAAMRRERLTMEERERFRLEILPRIADVSVGVLSRATSLSKSYCSFIKRGMRTPHPRHWAALATLIGRAS